MTNMFFYIIQVNLVFIVLYVFYFVFFRNLTFHHLNRAYLLLCIPCAFIIPILHLDYQLPMQVQGIVPEFVEFIPSDSDYMKTASEMPQTINYGYIISIFYLILTSVFVCKLVLSSLKILQIKQKQELHKHGKCWIIDADVSAVFSFFNWIFVPMKRKHQLHEAIIEHEKVHASMWHTLDLIITELFIALFWFNPFVYIFRNSLKSVHEFQVDAVISSREDFKSRYLQLISENLELNYQLSMVCNYFNGKTIKNRVKMITKNKSSRRKLISYVLVVPVIAILLQSFAIKNIQLKNKPAIKALFDTFSMEAIQKENKPSIKPIEESQIKYISSGYGKRLHPITKKVKMHSGVDFVAEPGTPVIATADGRVIEKTFKEQGKGYGRHIAIQHDNVYVSVYTQLSGFNAEVGDVVKKGDVIGYVGSSGISTGPHLHYEVQKDGERVNPADYF